MACFCRWSLCSLARSGIIRPGWWIRSPVHVCWKRKPVRAADGNTLRLEGRRASISPLRGSTTGAGSAATRSAVVAVPAPADARRSLLLSEYAHSHVSCMGTPSVPVYDAASVIECLLMLIVVSPAKALDYQRALPVPDFTQPAFLDRSEALIAIPAREKSGQSIARLMALSISSQR